MPPGIHSHRQIKTMGTNINPPTSVMCISMTSQWPPSRKGNEATKNFPGEMIAFHSKSSHIMIYDLLPSLLVYILTGSVINGNRHKPTYIRNVHQYEFAMAS
ncbi:hypothetical protein EUGRSUZ_J01187 [Eucalyptus grandis]|uniref:Uncharacterized protein n=2 Tax=Eucalyptus grandis TaxID=71139 RepID=A0ACC3J4N4_EUCGR|nr:hypothetical protein EUGRSUZ_J01187 [Eucalyptus grandis]